MSSNGSSSYTLSAKEHKATMDSLSFTEAPLILAKEYADFSTFLYSAENFSFWKDTALNTAEQHTFFEVLKLCHFPLLDSCIPAWLHRVLHLRLSSIRTNQTEKTTDLAFVSSHTCLINLEFYSLISCSCKNCYISSRWSLSTEDSCSQRADNILN